MKTIGTETHRQVADAFVQASGYADDERVRAVFIVGSSASGKEDAYSDVDVMIVVNTLIPDDERLERLRTIGGRNIMLSIAGVDNPALPVQSQVFAPAARPHLPLRKVLPARGHGGQPDGTVRGPLGADCDV